MGLKIETKKNCFRNSLVVNCSRTLHFCRRGQLRSMIRELGSHKMRHVAKKKKNCFVFAISIKLRQLIKLVCAFPGLILILLFYIFSILLKCVCCVSLKIFASVFIKRDYSIAFLSFLFFV